MKNNYFCKFKEFQLPDEWDHKLKEFSENIDNQVFIIREPLSKENSLYDYKEAFVLLIPGYKLIVVNLIENNEYFEEFIDDFLDDLAYLSDKFSYMKKLGRPRKWKDTQIMVITEKVSNIDTFLQEINLYKHTNEKDKRISELLISLLTGSVNDIDILDLDEPTSILDKVKQKIVLFDGDQTRFIFEDIQNKLVRIQGLAGTGKTELLLHKLKELYVNPNKFTIGFTCHSKTLASNLRARVPDFFTFMKVEEQIEWNKRLFVFHSWGSGSVSNSGLYATICQKYSIPFYSLRFGNFGEICQRAINDLNKIENFEPIFDYLLIDASQDFSEEFFELCKMITNKTVYLAGDIFQTIFDKQVSDITPDFLLNKVYRTDPRTLMFSQAIGLGLFERPVINWLNDRELEACGYSIEKEKNRYILSRNKIRRFEDIDNESILRPVHISSATTSNVVSIIGDTIQKIMHSHSTVTPDDIGIVFIDSGKYIYNKIDELEDLLYNRFKWTINRGFDNKGQIGNTVFVSNRNNIKGLEFPFIICVTCLPISKSIASRNVLYMTMTRSFISSFLILSDQNEELMEVWSRGLESILENDKLIIDVPSADEILSEEALNIEKARYQTLEEIKTEIFKKYDILEQNEQEMYSKILNAHYLQNQELTKQDIDEIVKANKEVLYNDSKN